MEQVEPCTTQVGSIADISSRLLLWSRRATGGMGRVEYDSEFSRQRVVNQLRASLAEQGIALHEVRLPVGELPATVVNGLLDQLERLEPGVVSISGFNSAFAQGDSLADALRVVNYNRENLAQFSHRQIWWMTPSFTNAVIHAMPDLNSWFVLRLYLREIISPLVSPMQVNASDSHYLNIDDARKRAEDLATRFEYTRSTGASFWDNLATFGLPALRALREAGAWREAQTLVTRLGLDADFPEPNTPEEYLVESQLLEQLAELYRDSGNFTQAEPLYLQTLEMRKRLLGEEHPDVATSLNNLAYLYFSHGCYEQAEPLLVQALEMRKRLLGEEHPDVATSLNNLAALYDSQGRYEQAEVLYVQALEMYKRLLGEEHPSVASYLNNLAALYDSQGRYAQAEPLYLHALEMRKRLLGEEHPSVALSLNNLAALYYSQGRYEQAEPLYKRALTIQEKALGPEHLDGTPGINNSEASYRSGYLGTITP